MQRAPLTQRQRQVLDYIGEQVRSKGYPPSVREISDALGLASPSTVHTHIKTLESKGYLRRDPTKPRAIGLVELPTAATVDDTSLPQDGIEASLGIVYLPILGRVAAGAPMLAEENLEGMLPMPTSVVGDAAAFVLRVRGDSMIGAGINDGDFVIVRKQSDALNGQVVVALIDDEATVKTFYREPTCVRLQPENPSMMPIYVKNPSILGRVIALVRTL